MAEPSRPLSGLLNWDRVDTLIERIQSIGPWYIFSPMKGAESLFEAGGGDAARFLADRTEDLKNLPHGPGWIYVYTPDTPSWIKIYDPRKCGSSCSMTTPPAWWEMDLTDPSPRIAPDDPLPQEKKSLLHLFKGK